MDSKRSVQPGGQDAVRALTSRPPVAAPTGMPALERGGFGTLDVAGMLSLQGSAGNTAVARAVSQGAITPRTRGLARQVPPAEGATNVITVNPVFVGDRAEERQHISDEAIVRLTDTARDYATLWLVATEGALMEAPEPDDPSAKRNYYRALAGNMLWASTSLFATWSPLVIPMSVVGAAVGTGAAAEASAPSGKPQLVPMLTQARDSMAASARDVARQVGEQCGSDLISDAEQQRHMLWSLIFPNAPFESSDALRAASLQQLTKLLQEFRAQWEAWNQQVEAEVQERALSFARSMSPAGAPPSSLNQPPDFRAEVERDMPFNPQLGSVKTPAEQTPGTGQPQAPAAPAVPPQPAATP